MSSSGMSAIVAAWIQLLLDSEEMLSILEVVPGSIVRDQLVVAFAMDFLVKVVFACVHPAQHVESCPRGRRWRFVTLLIDKNLDVLLVLVVFHTCFSSDYR